MKYKIDEMTYVEVKEAMAKGIDTVVLPVGAIEQHGPHGVFGVDSFCALEAGDRVAKKLGALLAPLMPYGCSGGHMAFPGTITVSGEALEKFTKDVCKSLIHHGFKKIVIVNGNEPNYYPIMTVIRELRDETGTAIVLSNWYAALQEVWKELPGIKGTEKEKWPWPYFMAHGGLLEIAATMAHDDKIVRLDLAVTYPSDRREAVASPVVTLPAKITETTKLGSYGDPRSASKELGEKWLDVAADRIASRVKQIWKTLETPPQ
ncbi:MAG: creatininase family protein [Thaumarchaeota archaeon]|nr:creatininase family protein [Nitrososphaerota archaeon]